MCVCDGVRGGGGGGGVDAEARLILADRLVQHLNGVVLVRGNAKEEEGWNREDLKIYIIL